MRQTVGVPLLGALLEALGPLLSSDRSPAELQVEVNDVILLGSRDPVPTAPSALLLVTDPGALDPHLARVGALVLKAGDRGRWGELPTPVLLVQDDVPWQHIAHVLSEACTGSATDAHDGDLFALANSIAAVVGGAIVIEDVSRRVLAHSSLPDQPIDEPRRQGIIGRQVPEHSGNDESYQALARSAGVVRLPGDANHFPRIAVAVRAGAEVLGSLWAIETEPIDEAAERGLLAASRLAAVHLLRARAEHQMQRRARSELLRAVLDGRAPADATASKLGVNPRGRFAILAFGFREEVAADTLSTDGVADLVHLQCAGVAPRACVVVQYDSVLALVPSDTLSRGQLAELARTIVRRADSALRVRLAGSVGATVHALSEVTGSSADAQAVLRVVPPGSVGAVEDLLPQVVLVEWEVFLASNPRLRLPLVEEVLRHDAAEHTAYAASALAYLESNGDIAEAARRVGVHPNTFRYRLKRLYDLFGLDLEDADLRLVLWLQLRSTGASA